MPAARSVLAGGPPNRLPPGAMNPALPRDAVHKWSEECAEQGLAFQSVARRIIEDHARLSRFFKSNLPQMPGQSGEVALYLLAVVVRIYERAGGKLGRCGGKEIDAATAKIQAHARGLLPGDEGFPARVRAVTDRAQPHILDEALHALFEREERKKEEVEIPPDHAAMVFLMLWAATEALDLAWTPPKSAEWLPPAPAT